MVAKYFFKPFTVLYTIVLKIRHYLYDHGLLQSQKGAIKTISIGNLTMGGSGKTPMINYLSNILQKHNKIAILSRGYGRTFHGFKEVHHTDDYSQVGDEPLLLKNKQPELGIYVDQKKVNGIQKISSSDNQIDIVLLDDAMQHRSIIPSIHLLLTDFHCIFPKDHLFPIGKLRDLKSRAMVSDIILVTKSPLQIEDTDRNAIKQSISKYSKAPVYFSNIQYEEPLLFFDKTTSTFPINAVLVSGIANHKPFEEYVNSKCEILKSYHYRDHFAFQEREINQWIKELKKLNCISIITTEKDAIRLYKFKSYFETYNIRLYTIPIRFAIENEDLFLQKLNSLIKEKE